MALTLTFTLGAPCAGDNHFGVRATIVETGQKIDVPLVKSDIKQALTADEAQTFVALLMRLFVRQLSGSTAAQIKTAIEMKSLDLTVGG